MEVGRREGVGRLPGPETLGGIKIPTEPHRISIATV